MGAETAPIPDLSGTWGRNILFFEPPLSGPGPIVSTLRKADGTMNISGGFVGDYSSPILKPKAAETRHISARHRRMAGSGLRREQERILRQQEHPGSASGQAGFLIVAKGLSYLCPAPRLATTLLLPLSEVGERVRSLRGPIHYY